MKTLEEYKDLAQGEIDHLYEGEGFWYGKDESLDELMDLQFCYERCARKFYLEEVDGNDLYEPQDIAWDVLEEEYELALAKKSRSENKNLDL